MSNVNPNDQAGDPVAIGLVPVTPLAPNSLASVDTDDSVTKEVPVNSEQANENHHARISELAVQLRNASPSGANSISDKILYHLNAIENPEQHAADQAKLKQAEDEREAERKKKRKALKAPVEQQKAAAAV